MRKLPVLLLFFWIVFSESSYQNAPFFFSKSKGKAAIQTVAARETASPEIQAVRQKIRGFLISNGINGNVAIVKDGTILFNEGIGFAHFSDQSKNHPSTTHPIGSITKAIVAACVLQLQEKGKLSIYDPVKNYFPHFPNGGNIELVHLLTHTSGIQEPHGHTAHHSPETLIRLVEHKPVKFSPGSQWDYNDANYVILGLIVEKVSGMPLHDYIQKNIFEPAKMTHSGFMTEKDKSVHSSVGYWKRMNHLVAIPMRNPNSLFGYADIYATALDVCKFDQALTSGKLLKKESLAAMLKPGSRSGYGLGLYNVGYAFYSRGVLGGWESLHVYYKDDTSITVLLNVRDKNLDIHQLAKELFKLTASEIPSPLSRSGDSSFYTV
ncbi:serine hydrolase domain-containing protein [Neobacillus sp. SM06]|uniref:serine hydrolase domain-containing protein n=1 Tax=Neobacillus sp. SM06 TaxID=3422492 RepID=UPI003D281B98